MDFSLTSEQQAFRQTVRAWLKENIPHEWKHLGSSEIPRLEAYELLREWQRKLYDAGFIGLTWPKEYGGRGLTFMEELILHERDRKSTRLHSSHITISYAVFCLKKKKQT